jgi:hypothetical protein
MGRPFYLTEDVNNYALEDRFGARGPGRFAGTFGDRHFDGIADSDGRPDELGGGSARDHSRRSGPDLIVLCSGAWPDICAEEPQKKLMQFDEAF